MWQKMAVFWVAGQLRQLTVHDVSEEHMVSIFKAQMNVKPFMVYIAKKRVRQGRMTNHRHVITTADKTV